MSKSYTPPDRSTYDPGWNDPPPMGQETANKPMKTKVNLNKRVAFPLQGNGNNTNASHTNVKTSAEGLPLPFSTAKYEPPASLLQPQNIVEQPTVSLPPPPSLSTTIESKLNATSVSLSESSKPSSIDLTNARDFCRKIFSHLTDQMAAKIDAIKLTEIRKRLDILNEMWLNGKFDQSIQIVLYNIALALDQHNVEDAKEEHRKLMVQHINLCTQWGTALRQVILSIELADADQDKQSGPAVLPDNEINVVQFLNVASTPSIIDDPALLPINSNSSTIVSQPILEPQCADASSVQDKNAAPIEEDTQNPTKSKFGRFGRILHL